MAMVKNDPIAAEFDFPYLKVGGWYGPGQENEAIVTVSSYVHESPDGPGYDKNFSRSSSYAHWNFKVEHQGELIHTKRFEPTGVNPETGKGVGSRNEEWLRAIGVEFDAEGYFDDDTVANRPCAISVRDPRQAKARPDDDPNVERPWFTGDVNSVIGV